MSQAVDDSQLIEQLDPSFVLDDKTAEITRLREIIQDLNFKLVMHTTSATQEMRTSNELADVHLELVEQRGVCSKLRDQVAALEIQVDNYKSQYDAVRAALVESPVLQSTGGIMTNFFEEALAKLTRVASCQNSLENKLGLLAAENKKLQEQRKQKPLVESMDAVAQTDVVATVTRHSQARCKMSAVDVQTDPEAVLVDAAQDAPSQSIGGDNHAMQAEFESKVVDLTTENTTTGTNTDYDSAAAAATTSPSSHAIVALQAALDKTKLAVTSLTESLATKETELADLYAQAAEREKRSSTVRSQMSSFIKELETDVAELQSELIRERALVRELSKQSSTQKAANGSAIVSASKAAADTVSESSSESVGSDESMSEDEEDAPSNRNNKRAGAHTRASKLPRETNAVKSAAKQGSRKAVAGKAVPFHTPGQDHGTSDNEPDAPVKSQTDTAPRRGPSPASTKRPTKKQRLAMNDPVAVAEDEAAVTVPQTRQARKSTTSNTAASAASSAKSIPLASSSDSPAQEAPKVLFSGFGTVDDPAYSITEKNRLTKIVTGFNSKIASALTPEVTHIIAPPATRTMKTLGACLSHRWIMTPEWISASERAGRLLPEGQYGRRYFEEPFVDKNVFIAPSFKNANRSMEERLPAANNLIKTFGRGKTVRKASEADIILVGDADEKPKHEKNNPQALALTWDEFLALIPGSGFDAPTGGPAGPVSGDRGRVHVTFAANGAVSASGTDTVKVGTTSTGKRKR